MPNKTNNSKEPKKKTWRSSYNKKVYKSRKGYYTYEEAKEKIQQTHVMSVCDYTRWWELNKPARMPKRPDRSYKNNGFTTWSKFLGSNNRFEGRVKDRNFLPYEQAKEIVHTFGINGYEGWIKFCRAGHKPDNIPRDPQTYYRKTGDWFTWGEWTGTSNKKTSQIETLQRFKKMIFISRPDNVPMNIFEFHQITAPVAELLEFIKTHSIIKSYLASDDFDWDNYLKKRFSNYYGEPNLYLIPNIHEVVYMFDSNLEPYMLQIS